MLTNGTVEGSYYSHLLSPRVVLPSFTPPGLHRHLFFTTFMFNIWHPLCFKLKNPPLRCQQGELANVSHDWGDEATPLPSTQTLSDIVEGHKIEAFTKIEEVELQHATKVCDTSIRVTESSQNNGGVPHQSPPRAPSPAPVVQEHVGSGQQQVED
jgi:hypothetical protein